MFKLLCLIAFIPYLHAATSVTTNGITFTFDTDYETGRFLDGEPWVVGPVTVTAMTPAYADSNDTCYHGYEVNSLAPSKSLDSRLGNFTAPPALPQTFTNGSSVLKVASRKYDGSQKTYLEQASVLTVLGEAPPANAFRPPYCGADKPVYTAADIHWDLLPALPELDSNQTTVAAAESIFGGVWIDHQLGSVMDRRIHPCSAIRHVGGAPCAEYGAELAKAITSALLRTTQEGRSDQLVYECIQTGIDMYHMYLNGMRWPGNGGKFLGRKGAIAYAGLLLDIPAMLQVGGQGTDDFQEDGQYFMGQTEALWGIVCPDGQYDNWVQNASGGKDCRDPEGLVDGSNCASGTYCDSVCTTRCAQPTPEEQRQTGLFSMGSYQNIGSHITCGVAALVRILGIEAGWDHPAFLQYADRIGTAPWNYYGVAPYKALYLVEMHRAYGKAAAIGPAGNGLVVPDAGPVRIMTNPCNGRAVIRVSGGVTDAAVYNQTGRAVGMVHSVDGGPQLIWDGYAELPGVYYYHIETDAGTYNGRIMKVE